MARLIDEALPEFDANSVHERRLDAPPDVAWAAVREVTTKEIRLLGPLMALRGLPARLRGRGDSGLEASLPILEAMERQGFAPLGERPHETALGIVGRPWRPDATSTIRRLADRDAFVSFADADYAKAAVDLRVVPDGDGSRVITETRIAGTDEGASRKFKRYWRLIGRGSALIRRSWLRAIARRAEAPGRA